LFTKIKAEVTTYQNSIHICYKYAVVNSNELIRKFELDLKF